MDYLAPSQDADFFRQPRCMFRLHEISIKIDQVNASEWRRMMRTRNWGAFVALTALSACATGPAPRTGFLGDYSGLAKAGKSQSLLQQPPPADFTYEADQAVIIDPPEVRVEGLSDKDKVMLSRAFRDALVKKIGSRLHIVGVAGDGVLRVRSAIVGARKANVAMNVVTTAVMPPLSKGGVAAEAEVLDSVSGQRVAALALATRGAKLIEPGLSYTRFGEAREGLRNFAGRLLGLLEAPSPG